MKVLSLRDRMRVLQGQPEPGRVTRRAKQVNRVGVTRPHTEDVLVKRRAAARRAKASRRRNRHG